MANCDYTLPFLKKRFQFLKETKIKFKRYIPSSARVLHCIINIFGLNISYQIGKFQKDLVQVCRKFAIICITGLMLLIFLTPFNRGFYTEFGIKTLLSYTIVESSSCILWGILFFSQKEMSNICKCIIKLKKAIKTNEPDTFASIFIIYTLLMYILSVIFELYPFTDEKYNALLSYLFIPKTGSKYLNREIVFIFYSIYHAFVDLLPQCFITLYIILCHHMHTILILYVKRNSARKRQSEARIIKWFDYYQAVMHTFESFEKKFTLSIFIVFSKSVIDIFFNVMYIYGNGEEIYIEICRIVVNFISITSVTLVASQISETDKIAKTTNLQNLEVLLKIANQFQLHKILKIWKLNNSPPCTLTAYGFFNFSKGLYLNAISIVITYSLLVINL